MTKMLSIRCAVECEEFQFLTIVHTFYRSTGVITYAGCWENTRKITSWKPIESAVHCFLTEKITMGSVTVNIWRSYLCTAVEETKISDPRSYEHYWTSSWNKAWKKFSDPYGIWTHDLCDTGAALYKPTGSRLLCWIEINLPMNNDCQYMKIIS